MMHLHINETMRTNPQTQTTGRQRKEKGIKNVNKHMNKEERKTGPDQIRG
jgi:hypothetical protein